MSNLINSSEQLKAQFSALSLNFTWENISSHCEDAERDIIAETIGQDALDYFTGNLEGLNGIPKQALILLQRSSAYLTILGWSQTALFQFEDKALYLAKSTTGAIPSDKKLRDLRASCEEKGFNYLDKAVDLLERNLILFPAYADSGVRQSANKCFIKTAVEFNRIKTIKNSRLTFLSLVAIMEDLQDEKLPKVMTAAYYALFKERYLDDELSIDEQKLLPAIQKVVAMFAIADACNTLPIEFSAGGLFVNRYNNTTDYDQKDPAAAARLDYLQDDYKEKGDRALVQLAKVITENATNLPGYIAPVTVDVQLNELCNGFFSFP